MSSGASATSKRSTSRQPEDFLTRREAADLASLSVKTIDKAVEQQVIKFWRAPDRQLFIPPTEVGALAMFKRLQIRMPKSTKRQIRDWLVSTIDTQEAVKELVLAPVLVVRLDAEVTDAWQQALEYLRARNDYIEVDPEIKGGMPVIRGTRLTTSAVATRLNQGDTMDEIAADYPYIERKALEAAAIYGRTHPRQGRPPRPSRPQ